MTTGDIPIAVSGARVAGRYRLDDRMHDTVPVGSTQGSQLWRATDEILGRNVVVRILPPGFARTDDVLAAACAASRLPDPRLARVFDACDGDGGAYIITEWPSGHYLDDLLAAGPLAGARAAALVAEAAGALAAAHAAGVFHLCLTPRSLLWNATTGAKVIGLGIDAALAGVSADDGGLADTRGLASLLYAALTARWPGTDGHTLPSAPQRTGQAYPPGNVRAGVPKQLDMVVRRALFGEARRGHPPIVTPAQMSSALSAAFQARVPPAGSPVAAGRSPRRPPLRRPAGSPLLYGATAVLATMIVSAGLWGLDARSGHTTGVPSLVPVQVRPVAAVGALTPADVRTFDPYGTSEGRTALATDLDPDTLWRSQWYTTARFGNLKTGTGLIVDLGSQAMITGVRITLGATPGADVEPRVGDDADSLSGPRILARVSPDAGVTDIPVTAPAAGRYVLIWLTRLPPQVGGSGHLQATVHEVTTYGIQ